MKTTDKERREAPVLSLLRGDQISSGQKAGVWAGIILTLCAIAVFIWLIVRAAGAGDARGIVMMSSFILFAAGFLYFFLARVNNPKRAWTMLYITVPLAVAAFVVSLYLNNGATAPNRQMLQAQQTERVYDASGGTVTQNDGNLK